MSDIDLFCLLLPGVSINDISCPAGLPPRRVPSLPAVLGSTARPKDAVSAPDMFPEDAYDATSRCGRELLRFSSHDLQSEVFFDISN